MESNPIGDMFAKFKQALDDYLNEALQDAVNEEIITDDQRNRIVQLTKTPTAL